MWIKDIYGFAKREESVYFRYLSISKIIMSVPGEGMWKKAQQEMNPSFHPDLKKTAPERAEVVIGEKGSSGLEDLLAELEENPTDPDLQRQVTLAEELVRRMKEIVKDQGNH